MRKRDGRGQGRGSPVLLYLRMAPPWAFVDEVRRFVEGFCASASLGPEREEQVALATHELVQNALENAATSSIELRLEVDGPRDRVEIDVSNVCAPGDAERLRALVAALVAQDPLAAYVAAMKVDPKAPGGLGLARLRHDAQLELEVHGEGDRVTVRACGRLKPAEQALAAGAVR